jgi:signal transduction histidine kinase
LNQDRWLIGFLSLCVLLLGAFFALWRQRLITKRDKILTEQRIIHQKEMTTALISSQEQERTRFASDLHDGMGQVMSSLRLVLQRSSGQTPQTAIELLDQMHRDIRGIAFDLSPTTLKEEGLPAALRELVSRLNQSSVIQITVGETGMETRLPSDMELALYRITQEWLNNIFRHGGAHKISLQIICHPDQISLMIEDDGPGFDPGNLEKSTGNGWRNIQSRLIPFAGTVHLDSQKGKQGTVFIAEFPFVS